MKIIGITGSSGAGKTTVSNLLGKKEYVEVIDCDKVAKKISVPGNIYIEKIKKQLGEKYILPDGNLNRKLLAEAIYNDEEKLAILNSITFKYVVEESLREIEKIKMKKDIEFIAIDAPLLFEAKMDKICDYVIALIADEEIKIARICKRDNIDSETARKRLKIQKEDSFYIEKSDFVIENNNENNLENTLDEILNKIKENQ